MICSIVKLLLGDFAGFPFRLLTRFTGEAVVFILEGDSIISATSNSFVGELVRSFPLRLLTLLTRGDTFSMLCCCTSDGGSCSFLATLRLLTRLAGDSLYFEVLSIGESTFAGTVVGDLIIVLDVPLVLLFVGGVLVILFLGAFVCSNVIFLEELRPFTVLESFDVDVFFTPRLWPQLDVIFGAGLRWRI